MKRPSNREQTHLASKLTFDPLRHSGVTKPTPEFDDDDDDDDDDDNYDDDYDDDDDDDAPSQDIRRDNLQLLSRPCTDRIQTFFFHPCAVSASTLQW